MLLVEDSQDDADLLLRALSRGGYEVEHQRVETAESMRAALFARTWDIVISDYALPKFDAPGALEVLRESNLDIPLIIVSGTIGEETAVAALRAGAKDFFLKGKLARLLPAVERELQEKEVRASRARTERALLASEERFRTLADSGMIGITIEERSGAILEANETFLRMVGYSREDLASGQLRAPDMTPSEWTAANVAALEQLNTHGFAPPWEKEYLRKDGTRVPVLVGIAALRAPHDIAISIDLTERKKLGDALRQSEQRYRKIIETVNEGVWMLDASLTTVFVNERMAAMLGRTPEDMIGRPASDFVHTESQADVERDFERRRLGIAGHTEATLKHRKGNHLRVLLDSAPLLGQDGGYEGELAMVMDVTQRKRLEEQLRQAQKMEAIGSLAGGIAHDFNNLLSVILGYTNLVLDDLKPGDPLRPDLDEVKRAAERAGDLTRQLLAFSRQQLISPRNLNINSVVTDMEKMLKRLLGEEVELSLLTSRAVGTIYGDSGQVEQIIMNLVVNARDAMTRGGKVALETSNVELDEEYAAAHHEVTPGRYVLLAVTDTGTGMDAATQARIFEPFFTTKDKGKGTGLGLSTVFGIVMQAGGHIWVYSEVGRGSTFKVYFPRVDGEVVQRQSIEPPRTLHGSETILLVEDEEQVRVTVRTILRRQGYNVLEAQNGGEAFLICEQYPAKIQLLLTDVVMPRMSGRELAERLAPMRPDMKVLYISGYTPNSIVHHGVLDSGVSFLQKPITPEALSRKVREVLDADVT